MYHAKRNISFLFIFELTKKIKIKIDYCMIFIDCPFAPIMVRCDNS